MYTLTARFVADADKDLSFLRPVQESDKQIPNIAAYCSFKHIFTNCTDVHDSSLVKQITQYVLY